MLRITTRLSRFRAVTVKLEGELREPWLAIVRDACRRRGRRCGRVRLDLADVRYADAAGLQLLRYLVREGVEIATCSSFVFELLHPSRP